MGALTEEAVLAAGFEKIRYGNFDEYRLRQGKQRFYITRMDQDGIFCRVDFQDCTTSNQLPIETLAKFERQYNEFVQAAK